MNESEESSALHDALHGIVDHVSAPPDLAERVESAARRRRTTRWAVAGMAVLVVGGTSVAIAVSGATEAGSVPVVSSTAKLPACAGEVGAYKVGGADEIVRSGAATGGTLVPGTPVAAVVCRYAGFDESRPQGDLVSKASLTSRSELAPLLAAMNKSQFDASGDMGCTADNLDTAVLEFVYAGGAPTVDVYYDMGCWTMWAKTGEYTVRTDLRPDIADWTGSWVQSASPDAH